MARPNSPVRLEYYPIEYLDPNPFQPRLAIDPDELAGLVASIARFGFSGYLEARRNPEDPGRRLQLVYGHRRLAAATLAGLRQVPVVTVERTDRELADQAFIENRTHKQLTPWEEAVFLRDYQQRHHCSIRDMADDLHVSKGFVQNRLDLFKIPEDSPIRPPLQADAIDMTTAMTLHALAKAVPEGELSRLIGQVQAGVLTTKDLQRLSSRGMLTTSVDTGASTTPRAKAAAAEAGDDEEGTVGQARVPTLGSTGRFAELGLTPPMFDPVPGSVPADQRVVPCGRDDDEERIESGMFQPDGTELEHAPAGERHAYLSLHALRQLVPEVEQHLPGADWTSLSLTANEELDDLLARVEQCVETIRAER
jgi:ParB/RepB/Spo0J family partition protein